jgi:hypothetical protein
LSPGLSPLGFVRGRPGRPRRRWLAVAKGSVLAELTGSHGASFTGGRVRHPGAWAAPARGCGAADSAGSCATDIAPSRFAKIESPPPTGGHVFLLSGHRGNWINRGAQSFRVKYLQAITTSRKYAIWPPIRYFLRRGGIAQNQGVERDRSASLTGCLIGFPRVLATCLAQPRAPDAGTELRWPARQRSLDSGVTRVTRVPLLLPAMVY